MIERVPATQSKVFEVMQPRLKVLQQAARVDRSQEIVAERQMRALRQVKGVIR